MVEVVISVAAKVAEVLVVPIGKQICYPFKYNTNMEELKKQVQKLTDQREMVQHSVDEAKRQGQEIEKFVEEWMKNVDEFAEKVVKPIIDEQDKAGKLCSFGFCSNLMTRYFLSKKAVKTAKDGMSLLGEGTFQKVSYRPAIRRTKSVYTRGYEEFDSRMPVFKELMEALADEDVNLIGVYGMGGVGKTTLVKRVAAQAIEDKLFDEVVMAEVTQTPDIESLQEQIADDLDLKFDKKSLPGRAAQLRERLKKVTSVLLILDNIWQKVDLDDIGIPFWNDEKPGVTQEVDQGGGNANWRKWKLLLTSRDLDVLQNYMNTKKNFFVDTLSDVEAKNLFWKIVNHSNEKPDFNLTAVGILRKCDGLPIAITTIANALKNKDISYWKNALQMLRRSDPSPIRGMETSVYSSIELSYNVLGPEEQSFFLLCSLHYFGSDVGIDDLFKYSMGLNLFKNVDTVVDARNRMHALISNLKASCLLLDGNVHGHVRMHDIIHAVAVSIASSNDKLMFNIQNGTSFKEMVEEKLPKDSIAVCHRGRNIKELLEMLEFPNLKFLKLSQIELLSLQIPDGLFNNAKELEVLDLTEFDLLSLPSSLCRLTNLQTLCLDQCLIGDIAIIGELKKLEILSFCWSEIAQLPREIGLLTCLRLLDLSNCSKLEVITPNVLSSLTRLEELYMGNSFVQWDVDGLHNASLIELKKLSSLTTLEIQVLDAQIMPPDLFFGKLEKYKIFIGDLWKWSDRCETSRTLKLKLNDKFFFSDGIKFLLNSVENLHLDEPKGVKNVLQELNGEGFQQLKHLHIQNPPQIQYISNTVGWGLCNVFPHRLESLVLHNLINLETIYHGQLQAEFFSQLKVIKVGKCDKLKHITLPMPINLSQLQEIEVTHCNKLEEIVFVERRLVHTSEQINKIEFAQLHTITLQCLPCLTRFGFSAHTSNTGFQEIFAGDDLALLPRMKNLTLSSIKIKRAWLNQLPFMSSYCRTLVKLSVEELSGLKFLFPYSMVKGLVQLRELVVQNCKSMEAIINTEEIVGEEGLVEMTFPKLILLWLIGLPKLTRFGSGKLLEFPSLRAFAFKDCPKLKTFFSSSTSESIIVNKKLGKMNSCNDLYHLLDKQVLLPSLYELSLDSLSSEVIWNRQFLATSSYLHNLTVLVIHNLCNLKFLFSPSMVKSLVQLEVLEIFNCQFMEVVVITEEERPSVVLFLSLLKLSLLDLPKLTRFCDFIGILDMSSLLQLCIEDCPNMETFISNSVCANLTGSVECSGMNSKENFQANVMQPFFDEKVQLSSLKELIIVQMDNLRKVWHNQLYSDSFCKLESLHLDGCNKLSNVFPSNMLGRLQSLEKLVVLKCASVEEIYELEAFGSKKTHGIIAAQLKTLQLYNLPKLKHVWNIDSQVILSSQNLHSILITYCDSLKSLFPSIIARGLEQLESLHVGNCMMEEIIAKEEEAEDCIIFNQLKYLALNHLPNLTTFYSGSCTIEFPCLQKLAVTQCPNMKSFVQGDLSTAILHTLQIGETKGCWEGDLITSMASQNMVKDAHSSVLADEKIRRLEALNSEAQSATFRHQDEMTYATSGDLKELNETVAATITKTQLDADHGSASTTETVAEDEMAVPLRTDTLPIDECGTQHTSETEGKLTVRVAGTVKTFSDENKRKLPIHESEFKTVPSQTEGESKINVKQSVKPAGPVATSIAGPSDTTAAEPVIVFPPREKDEILAMTEAATVISFDSKGDEGLFESGLDVKSSIKRTVLKIIRCMSDVKAGKIGVHGIGGIGKTSVLKALISYAKMKGIFDLIILVSVSRYWSVKKIQNEVIKQLSLSREDSETDSQVAKKLFEVLSAKKFLLLLDDVWECIDFKAVGIPDPVSENGCKIVVASSKLNVCYNMDVIRVIEVETMSREEAYELFSKQVGRVSASPDIQPFAHAIVKGCGGLPLLTIVTGRALTEENNVTVWEHASKKFQLTGTATTYAAEDVIQLLKFSFDRLTDYDMQSCFLYCCLFSEDKEIRIVEFIEHCIQEGLIDGRWGCAHKRGLDIVDVLVRAFLVVVTEGGDTIKMHDSIRDLALGIISSVAEGRPYLLRAYSQLREPLNPGSSLSFRSLESPKNSRLLIAEGPECILRAGAGLTEPPLEEEWKQARMIFLMDNNLRTLPERPNCPKLLTLFLQRNYQLRVIPPSFFDLMTSLKVLNLSKTRVKSLPKALFQLKDLQVLILRDCERLVMLPPAVGCLECLEVLDLQGTEINKLPNEIGKLALLRHLKVSFYGSIDHSEYFELPHELISGGILSSLHALETLSIAVHPGDQRWYEDVKSVITDISNLTELTSLCFQFPQVEHLELFLETSTAWNAQHLTEFKFVVGHQVKSISSRVPNHVEFDYSQRGQCLRFVNGERIPDAILKILARSSAFFLDHHLDICSLSDFGVTNINGLKLCIISECPRIEKVVDSRNLTTTLFPCLERLSIHHLWNLTCIWEGIVPERSFAALKRLSVCACPKLKYVFSSSMIQFVPNLGELAVEDCPAIEDIVLEGEIIDSDAILLPNLKKLTLHYLPGLVNIWKSAWPSLEHVSFYNCPRLKNIGIDSRSIREIKAEKSWWDELEWEDTAVQLHLQKSLSIIHEDDL